MIIELKLSATWMETNFLLETMIEGFEWVDIPCTVQVD